MKTLKIASMIFAVVFMAACKDDDNTPEPVNEEEVITTITLTLTPDGGGAPVIWQSRDADGDGPNAPVITVSGNLAANTTYNGVVVLLNETEDPAENITLEVIEEADEHQMFFIVGGALNATFDYSDMDSGGNPLGIIFTVTTTDASTGTVNTVLRHEPTKPNDGTLAGAGGETDISATFDVTIE